MPISGGGGGAPADVALPLTTKGDLLGHSTVDVRIPVSVTDGHVLTVSAAAAPGIAWAAPAAGSATLTTGTYAAIPAAGTAGNVYAPNNAAELLVDTGAAWIPFGPIFPLSDPNATSKAWRNQTVATVSSTRGGEIMTFADGGPADYDIHGREITYVPSTTTSLEALFLPNQPFTVGGTTGVDNVAYGLYFADNATGKLTTFGMGHDQGSTSGNLYVFDWDSATVFNGAVSTGPALYKLWGMFGPHVFMRIVDNNTNHLFQMSGDGVNWQTYYSRVRTTFLATPTRMGYFGYAHTAASVTGYVHCQHYKVTA